MAPPKGRSGVLLPLQLLLFSSIGISAVWFIITLSLLIYKSTYLPFPPAALPLEIVGSALLLLVNYLGCSFGIRGNLTESTMVIIVCIGILLVTSAGCVYYMWLQTYVTLIDMALSASLLGINAFTILLGLVAAQWAASSKTIRYNIVEQRVSSRKQVPVHDRTK